MYGLNDSWSQNSGGSGLERKEMIESEMHRFEINFIFKRRLAKERMKNIQLKRNY